MRKCLLLGLASSFSLAASATSFFNTDDIHGVATVRGGWDIAEVTRSGYVRNNTFDPASDHFLVDSNWQHSAVWSAFLGAELPFGKNDCYRWQTGLSYYITYPFDVSGTVDFLSIPQFNDTAFEYKVRNQRAMFENKWLIALDSKKRFYFFLLGGVGVAFNTAYDYYEYPTDPNTTTSRKFADHTETSFSYSVGAGVEVAISEQFRVGLGYQYSDLGEISLGDNNTGNNQQDTLKTTTTPTNELLLQASYIFG